LNVILVGSTDRQLFDLLRGTGAHVASLEERHLSTLATPSARQPDVLVLDVRGSSGIPSSVAALKRHHPNTGVVIVVSTLDPAVLLDAMRAGVNELLSEPLSLSDVAQAIARVTIRQPTGEIGQVFGFVGAKGGVGTTTVAVNVAIALGVIATPGRCLLIDLHRAGGDAAVFLGAEPRFSVLDALENTHRLDTTFLHSLTTRVTAHLDLLASSDRAVREPANPAMVRALIEFASTAYRYVVLDLPRADGAVLDSLDQASTTVIVANQELATVRSANRLVSSLVQRYGRDKVSVVLSRSDRQADIGSADVERAVGMRVAHTFPSEYRLAVDALNKGRPLAVHNHNDLSAAFRQFARELAGVKAGDPVNSRAGLLGLLRRS
jgi:pilus assembly protein CpaE